jgi:hypothetical protein
MDAGTAVQGAVYTILSNVSALTGKVFDHIPEDQPLPYITISDRLQSGAGTHDAIEREVVVNVRTWTDARGNLPGDDLADAAIAALDHQHTAITAEMDEWSCWMAHFESSQSLGGPDPDIRQRVDRLRFHVAPVEGD